MIPKKSKKPIPKKPAHPGAHEEGSPITYSGPDYEIRAILKRIAEMKKHLDTQANSVYKKAGLSETDIKEYFGNPNNFSRANWEKIQKYRDVIIDQISQIFTPESQIKRPPKSKERIDKERRGKTLGSRKKWIFVK